VSENEFWAHIEKIIGFQDQQIDFGLLISEEDFYDFEVIIGDKFKLLDQWVIREACYLLFGGLSDDMFIDCRFWIIFLGKDYFEKVFANPDVLVEMIETNVNAQFNRACSIRGQLFRHDRKVLTVAQQNTLHVISGSSSALLPFGPRLNSRADYFSLLPRLAASVVAAGKKFPELLE